MQPFEYALKEYGNKELAGILHNPEVLKYSKETKMRWVKDDETAWCAIFIGWCLYKAGRQYTGQALARSYLKYGVETKKPELGDIVVLWRVSKNSAFGHVGFYIREKDDQIYILGGNQSDAVNITAYPKSQLLGFRKIPLLKHA